MIFSAVMISLILIITGLTSESFGQLEENSFDIAAVGDIGCRNGGETI